MKINPVAVYATIKGSTFKVVKNFGVPYYKVTENFDLIEYDPILIFCPTYGDEELPELMENFLTSLTVPNKNFAICELGNYFGYGIPCDFGSAKIIERCLFDLKWKKFYKTLSLDSVPKINWDDFFIWKKGIYELFRKNSCR